MKKVIAFLFICFCFSFSQQEEPYWLAQADIEETTETKTEVMITNYNQAFLIKAKTYREAQRIWNSYIKQNFKKGSIIREGSYYIRKVDNDIIIGYNDLK